MKSKVDKLGIGKLKTTPVDLSEISNIVKKNVVKKTAYNELAKKVNAIQATDTSDLVKKMTITKKLIKSKRK